MFETVALTAIILSTLSLLLSTVAVAFVVGFKNSTHTIEWKPLTPPEEEKDPFTEEPIDETLNPNKRKPRIKNPFPVEEVKEEDPFIDFDDPNITTGQLL